MARKRYAITRYEIIQTASELFFERGYSNTSPKLIAEKLKMSPGNLTYYFPTKEDLLAVLVELLCDFQWKMFQMEADRGIESLGSVCLELLTVTYACQLHDTSRDFLISAFQSEKCREYLRNFHVERAKRILGKQCSGWTHDQFVQAEILVMGMEYFTAITDDSVLPIQTRVAGALDQILKIYQVDEETRKKEIQHVLQMDCEKIGSQVRFAFHRYVREANEQSLKEMLEGKDI